MALNTSGLSSETSLNWTEIPDSLEKRLAASNYLVEIGLHTGSGDDKAYVLTVALAEARKANKDLYDSMSAEVRRYKERWHRERLISNDLADENADLDEKISNLEGDLGFLTDSLITAQERLDSAMTWCDDLSQHINWDALTGDNDA